MKGTIFRTAYFSAVLSDAGSVLYQELKQNQNIDFLEGYYFPESNPLLHFLFSDVHTAEKLAVWKPIGETVLRLLRPDESTDLVIRLNGSAEGFEEECWKSPIYAGIFFFDLMVTAAAYQGVQWHMWLYYFPYIIERLEEIYDTSNPSVDTSDEFPTCCARLIL